MEHYKVYIYEATPGMIVAEDVYTFSNHLLIPKGSTLNDKMITRMKFYSINDFLVEKQAKDDNNITVPKQVAPPKEEIYSDKIKSSAEYENYNNQFQTHIDDYKSSFNQIIHSDKPIDTDDLFDGVTDILDTGRNTLHLFDLLHCTREHDDSTYVHSINVSLISYILGQWLHYSKEDLKVLALCGLLHDIGKMQVPLDILNKPSKLTDDEYNVVKLHPIKGYAVLQNKDIDKRIKSAVLMHHERCDGSGYPSRLKKSKIDPFAKIVAIADVYDAMTSARVYRGPLCPFEVVALFEAEGLHKFDTEYIMVFLENIVQTYLHNEVRLSNGMEGEIILINKLSLSKPTVKVGNHFIDLSKERNVSIIEIL